MERSPTVVRGRDLPPIVVMDEAGNTGENLLDSSQPVFSLAAVHGHADEMRQAVSVALTATPMPELKFAKLRSTDRGRKIVLRLLGDLHLTERSAAVSVVHKPWMLAAKLVDELIEPRMLAKGIQPQWYASGSAKNMAHALYELGPPALGEMYPELQGAFVPLLRDYSPAAADAFLTALRRCRIVCRDARVADLLSVMIDTEPQLESEFAAREDALEPALPSLFWQTAHWSGTLNQPFEVIHDDSNTVKRWTWIFDLIRRNAQASEDSADRVPDSLSIGEVDIAFPTQLQTITFGKSDTDERLQVTDILAGAATHVFAVVTGERPLDSFAHDLIRAGVGELIQHHIGPEAPRARHRDLPAARTKL